MKAENWFLGIAFVAIMGLSMSCGVMQYNECRKVFSMWYCMQGR